MTSSLAIGSFIEHCDEMLIAEEGVKEIAGKVKDGAVTAGKAVGRAGAVAGKNIAFAMKTAADKIITMVKRIILWFKQKIFEIKSKKDDSYYSTYTPNVSKVLREWHYKVLQLQGKGNSLTSEEIKAAAEDFNKAYKEAVAKDKGSKSNDDKRLTQQVVLKSLQEDYVKVSQLLKEVSQFKTMASNPNQSDADRAEAQEVYAKVKNELKLAQLALSVDSKMLKGRSGTQDSSLS